ncbi:hypothetical protein SC65A3_00442 [Psychrobacter sp. SC65A.3]|uniref:HD domain-containing protein n=1 Tax=Psychrobacter sp. SC65A.3 TaxID=2983299 RepID=UPI0021D99DB2|nr:hypothetical protein [Psychrobacter sp. SC65A.3]WAI86992.1 hypothetical protein SC65A3_00442 [Psychrobacter sp. SC65A.3]
MDGLSQIDTELGTTFEWHLTAINNAIEPAILKALWQDIAVRYNESQRAYHSLQHIQQLFLQFEKIKHQLHEPHIIALALYYHDIIYDPRRSDNELKSAEYAVEALKGYLSAEQCQHIYALIMMTATHELHECLDTDTVSDAAYFLDMDLSILGTPWSEYQVYAQAVRQEYRHIANEDYRTGRIAVLQKLLAHPVLYLTAYYHNQFEVQARDNIKREISLLHAS